MANNASPAAYERLISAVRTFDKRTLEISTYLVQCSQLATTAMNNDDPSVALQNKINAIVGKMLEVSEKAGIMRSSMQKTLDYLQELEENDHGEE